VSAPVNKRKNSEKPELVVEKIQGRFARLVLREFTELAKAEALLKLTSTMNRTMVIRSHIFRAVAGKKNGKKSSADILRY